MIANIPLKYGRKNHIKELKEKIILHLAFNQKENEELQMGDENSPFYEKTKKTNYFYAFHKTYKRSNFPKTQKRVKRNNNKKKIIFQEEVKNISINFQEKVIITFQTSKILNLSLEGQLMINSDVLQNDCFLKLSDYFINPEKIKININNKVTSRVENAFLK